MSEIYRSRHFAAGSPKDIPLHTSLFIDCTFEDYPEDGKDIRESSFVRCHFSRSSLCKAQMHAAKFLECDFIDVDFRAANLVDAVFSRCTFRRCYFSRDNLGAETDLTHTRFIDSKPINCVF